MKIGIMQPYFFPYIGYFQLINAVDAFVVYDNIKYTKKGWINRNRFLSNGKDEYFTIPLKKDSDFLDIRERFIADDFNKMKLIAKIREAYKKAPYFDIAFSLFESSVMCSEKNLFDFILFSIKETCKLLNINTKIVISSRLNIDHSLKSQDKVIAICEAMNAKTYINPIGGVELYSKEQFFERGIELKFLKSAPFEYKQFDNIFVPWLSIIDVLMFNSSVTVSDFMLNHFELL